MNDQVEEGNGGASNPPEISTWQKLKTFLNDAKEILIVVSAIAAAMQVESATLDRINQKGAKALTDGEERPTPLRGDESENNRRSSENGAQ